MTAGTITLGIPGTGSTDFATTPIPSMVLSHWIGHEPKPKLIGYSTIGNRSNWGTAAITAPAYHVKASWAIAVGMSQADALQLAALIQWQDSQWKSSADGTLRLIDECNYLQPEPTPHSHTLLSTLHPAWNAGYDYGYGVFAVKLIVAEDFRQRIGVVPSATGGDLWESISFIAEEL